MEEIDYATNTLRAHTHKAADWHWINILSRCRNYRGEWITIIVVDVALIIENCLLIKISHVLSLSWKLFYGNRFKKSEFSGDDFSPSRSREAAALDSTRREKCSWKSSESTSRWVSLEAKRCVHSSVEQMEMFCCRKKRHYSSLCIWQASLTIHSRDDDIRRLIITYFHPTSKHKRQLQIRIKSLFLSYG